jgi:hypothetical protein
VKYKSMVKSAVVTLLSLKKMKLEGQNSLEINSFSSTKEYSSFSESGAKENPFLFSIGIR